MPDGSRIDPDDIDLDAIVAGVAVPASLIAARAEHLSLMDAEQAGRDRMRPLRSDASPSNAHRVDRLLNSQNAQVRALWAKLKAARERVEQRPYAEAVATKLMPYRAANMAMLVREIAAIEARITKLNLIERLLSKVNSTQGLVPWHRQRWQLSFPDYLRLWRQSGRFVGRSNYRLVRDDQRQPWAIGNCIVARVDIVSLYTESRSSAARGGVTWRLTVSEFVRAWRESGHLQERTGPGGMPRWILTRIDPLLGFEVGNIVVSSRSSLSTSPWPIDTITVDRFK